ncbi:hypothetical protein V8C44DRAFT_145790 [Trichoderma aethiopicum]
MQFPPSREAPCYRLPSFVFFHHLLVFLSSSASSSSSLPILPFGQLFSSFLNLLPSRPYDIPLQSTHIERTAPDHGSESLQRSRLPHQPLASDLISNTTITAKRRTRLVDAQLARFEPPLMPSVPPVSVATAGLCTGASSRPSSSIYGLLWATVSVFISSPSRLASATPDLCLSPCPVVSFLSSPFNCGKYHVLPPRHAAAETGRSLTHDGISRTSCYMCTIFKLTYLPSHQLFVLYHLPTNNRSRGIDQHLIP